jgi:hypothetical protein
MAITTTPLAAQHKQENPQCALFALCLLQLLPIPASPHQTLAHAPSGTQEAQYSHHVLGAMASLSPSLFLQLNNDTHHTINPWQFVEGDTWTCSARFPIILLVARLPLVRILLMLAGYTTEPVSAAWSSTADMHTDMHMRASFRGGAQSWPWS